MKTNAIFLCSLFLMAITVSFSCNDKFSKSIFKTQSPHEAYEQKLKNAGLNGSIVFNKWILAAQRSLLQPVEIKIPYLEKGYFLMENPEATGLVFEARNGELLQVKFSLHSTDSTQLFLDLFTLPIDSTKGPQHLESIKTGENALSYIIEETGRYIIRIQPELLASVSYELEITAAPSLGDPVAQAAKHHTGSYYGDGRDAGQRKHEGIDIFAARATPAVAAADGIISHVGLNNLGGKVIFLKPNGRSINLYYAHLDSQLVANGKIVKKGDTIGLIGNTGNAITTAPHLHFGIYTANGAVDPLPFIQSRKLNAAKITANSKRIGDTVLLNQTPSIIQAAAANGYRLILPDQSKTFVAEKSINPLLKPIKSITLAQSQPLYNLPRLSAAILREYNAGTKISVFGNYNGFYFIKKDNTVGWIKQ
ncbi:M23 family metallopeptidase [Pedobacter sp.]|uniref:M23 family metallopeptidase n=1 Tax=Pedobacter sp. TaxID=1411316 RepID=UPI003D7F5019